MVIIVDDKGCMVVFIVYCDFVVCVSNNCFVLIYNLFEVGCLWLYVELEWEWVCDDVMFKFNIQCVVCLLQQKLVGLVVYLELDGNGCISIFVSYRGVVGIEKKVVLFGMGDKFELWSEQVYWVLIQQMLFDEDLGDGLFDLKL